ncbi:MAG: MurR/RpiR family transcriptional regulator [Oscillospiraceae bacterium]
MTDHIFSLIRTKYNTLSESQQIVANYILKNAEKVMTSSLGDLASACSVSEPTVFRFLRKLGFDSYQVFRVNIAQELSRSKPDPIYEDVLQSDGTEAIITKVIASTARAIQDSEQVIDPHELTAVCNSLLTARQTLIVGIGASAAPAFDLRHKLLKLGFNTNYTHDPHLMNIMCGNLAENDLVVAFSHSGESREILDGVKLALSENCTVVAITSYPNSTLATLATHLLLSSSQETHFRSDAMISRIIQMTIIDMIYISLALKMGDSAISNIDRSRIAVANNKT